MDVNKELKFFVKIKKKKIGWVGLRGGGGGGGQSGCERRIEVFVKIQKKNWGGGGRGRGRVWGVRVDVIEELKSFWENSQKKKLGGGGVRGGWGGGGSGWMRTKN